MDTLSYKTVSANKETAIKEWILIDADNEILGRLATKIAMILRGKHKPSFTPHADCGDNVVIINASKVRLTGNKWTQREHRRHSGYPGGQTVENPARIMQKDPRRVIEHAVRGMLPKNKLGDAIFRNMRVYSEGEHEQQAQQPKQIDLNKIK